MRCAAAVDDRVIGVKSHRVVTELEDRAALEDEKKFLGVAVCVQFVSRRAAGVKFTETTIESSVRSRVEMELPAEHPESNGRSTRCLQYGWLPHRPILEEVPDRHPQRYRYAAQGGH
jgi:hypothetical protein